MVKEVSSDVVVKNDFKPRKEIFYLNKPFNWTVKGLRSVEDLSNNYKKGQYGQLVKNIAKFAIALLATIISLPTIVAPILLMREYTIQKENEIYRSCKNKASNHPPVDLDAERTKARNQGKQQASQKINQLTNQLNKLKSEKKWLNAEVKQQKLNNRGLQNNITNLNGQIQAKEVEIKSLNAKHINSDFYRDNHARFQEEGKRLLITSGYCAEEVIDNARHELLNTAITPFLDGKNYDPTKSYGKEPQIITDYAIERIRQLENALNDANVAVPPPTTVYNPVVVV